MSDGSLVLLVVVGVMALNQLVMRVGALKARPSVFYGLQAVNVVVGSAVIAFGLPGFEAWPPVSWMVGLLLVFRTLQNNTLRARWLRRELEEERRRRAREVQRALEASEDGEAP